MSRVRVCCALVVCLVLTGWALTALWPAQADVEPQSHVAKIASGTITTGATEAGGVVSPESPAGETAIAGPKPGDFEQRLPSHVGTAVDGGVTLDNEGRLVLTRDLRRLFDYFLTGVGRASTPEIRSRLNAHLVSLGLPAGAQAQVLAVYDRYTAYRQRLAQLGEKGLAASDLGQTLQARDALRREMLGLDGADAFFGNDDAIARYLVAKRELGNSSGLTDAERAQRLAMLERAMPEQTRAARARTASPMRAHEAIARMRQAGASDAEIAARRAQLLGPVAAQRLSEVDARRDDWQRRYEDYRSQRARILANEGLAREDRVRAVEDMVQERFDAAERRRVQSLDYVKERATANE